MKRNNFLKALIGLPLVLTQLSFAKKEPKEEITFFTPEMLSRNNYGLFIINSRVKEVTNENVVYAATVSWKLSYDSRYFVSSPIDNTKTIRRFEKYGITNFLTDGWYCPVGSTHEAVCEYLNSNKYRLMTKEEVLFIISKRQQGFL